MKIIKVKRALRYSYGHGRKYWPVAVVLLAVLIGVGSLRVGHHQTQGHEGGVLLESSVPSQVKPLADTTPAAVSRLAGQSVTSCADNGSGKLLLVSISAQHLWACDGTQVANETAVTTGASGLTNVDDATPTGTWHIYSKQTNTTLKGCDVNGCWNDPVAYWMPFDGEVGFHDASWQTFPFGSSLYTTQGSHGCVHLPTDFIAWVYSWAPIGTTVTVES